MLWFQNRDLTPSAGLQTATKTCDYLRRRIHDDHLFTNTRIEYKHASEAV